LKSKPIFKIYYRFSNIQDTEFYIKLINESNSSISEKSLLLTDLARSIVLNDQIYKSNHKEEVILKNLNTTNDKNIIIDQISNETIECSKSNLSSNKNLSNNYLTRYPSKFSSIKKGINICLIYR